MAAAEWWCWPLPAWLGSGAAWFVLLSVVVGAIFALSSRAAQPQSPSARRGGAGITRRASSVLLQRLRSFSVFSSPSSAFDVAAPDSPAALRGAEDVVGTTPCAVAVAPPAAAEHPTPASKQEEEDVVSLRMDEEDADSLSMDDVYALVRTGRHRPPPAAEEEAATSEVDAKAEEFIRGFKEDLRQQRLDSIANYTQMLKRRAAGRRPPVATPETNH